MLMLSAVMVNAQTTIDHEVKKKETIFGIARENSVTVEQLVKANPGMESPEYQLKKGSIIKVPVTAVATSVSKKSDVRQRNIQLGVMLPLNNTSNEGRRMVEYYRGVLMACDSVKKLGISVDVYAWNLPENGNVETVLANPNVAKCDLIIGPVQSKFEPRVAEFALKNDIMLVLPFSVQSAAIASNPNIFQIYQESNSLLEPTARRCADWFKNTHMVIVDCGDSTSNKGAFTSSLRRQLEVNDRRYSLTSLKSPEANFAAAFVKNQLNVVVLNSARESDMIAVFNRLKTLHEKQPDLDVSVFGYMEWLGFVQKYQRDFHRYNVYVPSYFYTNLQTVQADVLNKKYKASFNQDMMVTLPRFALTGFDHAYYFLRGLHKYGRTFDGAAGRFGYQPVQNPLKFERVGNGGYRNRAYLFVHYKPDFTIETVNY